MGIENKIVVLCVDSIYRHIGFKSVAKAFIAMNSNGEDGEPSWLALDMTYEAGETDGFNLDKCIGMTPVQWDDWVKLPVRDFDLSINTIRGPIRIPSIVVSQRFAKTIMKEPKLTKGNIRARDNDTCQYTGRKLNPNAGNVDHVIPISRGGKNTWENMVWCDKMLNFTKADKTPEEAGLKLIRKPFKPKPLPMSAVQRAIKGYSHPDWKVIMKD